MKISIQKKIYLHDTDLTGNVYYSRYLDWLEEARLELLAKYYKPFKSLDFGIIPTKLTIEYKKPLTIGEEITVKITNVEATRASILIDYSVTNGNGEETTRAYMVFVCVQKDKITKIPDDLRKVIELV